MKYNVTSLVRAALLMCCLTLAACNSCQEELPPPKPPVTPVKKKVEPKPDPVDPLKEAKEDATKRADQAAVAVGDSARNAASEIEAMLNKPKPIAVKRPKMTGVIDPKAAKRVFNKHLQSMKKCYERQLKRNPGLEGKVTLSVVIQTDGTVGRAKANGRSLKNAKVNDCMEREARTMKFPKPKGGSVTVNNPYTFTPDI